MEFCEPLLEHLGHLVALVVISTPQSMHVLSPEVETRKFAHEDTSLASTEVRTATFDSGQGKEAPSSTTLI